MSANTPQQFAARWQNTTLGERQSYQIHFMEVCDLVGHERPTGEGVDSHGRRFGFESSIKKDAGGQGFADVFYEGFFAIEYKAPGKYKDLNEAYQQLLQYREKLNNPPLLVVTDIQNWQIHTNWPNTEKRVYSFTNAEIASKPSVMRM
ncbi:MAG: class I SAM-dependent DNA methyltransferase, partial [Anaerolineae bacterium]|nr:class I SAM-dependent DNA methyltransferase [Anaerolineae bacterium]